MKKILKTGFLFLSSILLFTACHKGGFWGVRGEGSSVTQVRESGTFSELEISVSAEVEYTQDSVTRLEVRAQQNILAVLDLQNDGTTLKVGFKREVWEYEKIKLIIHTPAMNRIQISGSGNIQVTNKIEGKDLLLVISGSGDITVPTVKLESLTAKISGSGNIRLKSGTCTSEAITVSGAGYINTETVSCSRADVVISGSGDVLVNAADHLNVTLSGSGNVKYHGKPKITSNISGSGKLISLD